MSLLSRLLAPFRSRTSAVPDTQSPPEWLVIGLGNPGPKYAGTRHNIGYLVTDELLRRTDATLEGTRGTKATTARVGDVLQVRSTTYMNLSGEAVAPLAAGHGIPADHVIVIHDELDLPVGKVKVKLGGNENGHNGLKSVSAKLGTRDYVRIRVGIGRPSGGTGIVDHVLAPLDDDHDWDASAATAADAVEIVTGRGLAAAQNEIHSRP